MIISDLEYLELEGRAEDVTGCFGFPMPSFSFTNVVAIAQPGAAVANAQAIAIGQNTFTSTNTYANTSAIGGGTLSLAFANATAYSNIGNLTVYSQSTAIAISISNLIPSLPTIAANRSALPA